MMCSGPKTNLSPFNPNMDGGVIHKNCSELLELAATDDLPGFIYEIEEKGSNIDEVSYWYGRSFGSKKMGYEERTPLMIACLYGNTEVLKYIIQTGKVDVNRSCGSDRATPLHCAAAGGSWSSIEVVKILIEASGDINAVDINGKKPGDLIAPCVKSCTSLKRKTLEMMLNGATTTSPEALDEVADEREEEGVITMRKEYPMDITMPDINNGLYGTDEFRMYSFKVKPCSRAYSHDWTECPFVHPGENARRRDPRKYNYTCVPCPEFKKGSCAKGDSCEYAHGVFESWLHPAQYRTRLCKDETGCSRKVCFFAHRTEELRPLYASTGSGMPSPKSSGLVGNSLDLTSLSPLSLSSSPMMNSSTSPISMSSPIGGWPNNMNLTPPALQLPGSRLKTAFSARDVDLHMERLSLDKIKTQQQMHQQHHHHQLVEEMAGLTSPYPRMGDLIKPTNLEDVFGLSPRLGNNNNNNNMNNMNQLRASYPSNMTSSSPSRKPVGPGGSPYGFDSSAAVAAAVMNSRSAGFAKRSQSFIDRSGPGYRVGPGSGNPPGFMQSKVPEWGSADGKLEWGFNGEENKLRKSASFGFRSGGGGSPTATSAGVGRLGLDEPDVSWVNTLVKDVPANGGGGDGDGGGPGMYRAEQRQQGQNGHDLMMQQQQHWLEQMYIEQEQIVA